MKKLVCLMLVALVGTVASAATMSFSGSATIDLNSTAIISIIGDADAISVSVGAIALSRGSATVGTLNPLFGTLPANGTQRNGTVNHIWITQLSGSYIAPTKVAAGQALYTFTISSEGLALGDVITIDDFSGTNPFGGAPLSTKLNAAVTALGSFAVTVVPEPMTVALLGLGGLFIRRRK